MKVSEICHNIVIAILKKKQENFNLQDCGKKHLKL